MSAAEGTAPGPRVLGSEEVKRCCAAAYASDAVALILGDSYHPGGLALTRRLARVMALSPAERVADIASGPGATAFLLAEEFGVEVDGIDLAAASICAANAKASRAGLDGRVRFGVGDAECLPLPDASVDALVCECALCTFPDKVIATAEMARVLKPGGRVGITDVTMDPSRLDPELASLAGWVACIADARPVEEYRAHLECAGLTVTLTESHDYALAKMVSTIDARLVTLAMLDAPALAGIDIASVRAKVAVAARAVADGVVGYSLLVAAKPTG